MVRCVLEITVSIAVCTERLLTAISVFCTEFERLIKKLDKPHELN